MTQKQQHKNHLEIKIRGYKICHAENALQRNEKLGINSSETNKSL